MKKQITRFSVHQTSKVMAIIYFVIAALFAIPFGIYVLFTTGSKDSIAIFLAPILYMVLGYLGFVIFNFIYNLVASSFGGIEFEMSDEV